MIRVRRGWCPQSIDRVTHRGCARGRRQHASPTPSSDSRGHARLAAPATGRGAVGPISVRNSTDLGAELDRSRRGGSVPGHGGQGHLHHAAGPLALLADEHDGVGQVLRQQHETGVVALPRAPGPHLELGVGG